jgi:hypothetical protein
MCEYEGCVLANYDSIGGVAWLRVQLKIYSRTTWRVGSGTEGVSRIRKDVIVNQVIGHDAIVVWSKQDLMNVHNCVRKGCRVGGCTVVNVRY